MTSDERLQQVIETLQAGRITDEQWAEMAREAREAQAELARQRLDPPEGGARSQAVNSKTLAREYSRKANITSQAEPPTTGVGRHRILPRGAKNRGLHTLLADVRLHYAGGDEL
jgi:hypothetical protein